MRKLFFFIACVVFISISKANEIDLIKHRIAEWHWEKRVDKAATVRNAQKWQQTLQDNQQWKDVDYADPSPSVWKGIDHLKRIHDMTVAYTAPWSSLKNNPEVFKAIENALVYWNRSKPKNKNWWWNEIEAPRVLGVILIMLSEKDNQNRLSGELFANLVKQMEYKRYKGDTGVNMADYDTHIFYSGLINNDESQIQSGLNNIFSISKPTVKEGIQFDNSYAQHDIMLHIFGYGTEYLKVETYIGAMVADTKFAMKGEHLRVFTDFITKTLIPQIRGRYTNSTSFGRQISRENFTDLEWLVPYLESLILIDKANIQIYKDTILRLEGKKKPNYHIAELQKHYWNTDFSFYQDKKYQFSIRMSSKFTEQAETNLNGENKLGGYRSIGSYSILQDGTEYFNIYSIWDWKKIPGTTTLDQLPIPDTYCLTPGVSGFAGGVSNGKIGASAFMQNQFGVRAEKSWFMFEGAVICLGNNISAEREGKVFTTVEQSFFKDQLVYQNNEETKKVAAGQLINNVGEQVLIHNNTAYLFPQKTNLNVSTQVQNGRWKDINDVGSNEEQKNAVFKVWINHGEKADKAAYQYLIMPGIHKPAKARKLADNFVILNQTNVQAVYSKSANKLMLVFFRPSETEIEGIKIKADRACIILIENPGSENPELYVADPSRKAKEVNIELGTEKINIQLPVTLDYAGSSVHYKKTNT
ncbi:silent information regulator protein Sir2 [Elizabethkingia bruuniana]|uniref:Silent information regulator protein Sir2 n=1 Tax=Elizabethkingia bruuniana TaxID=1756149 RepID=A0A7T7UVV4_9FLAO|nr:polysaccharide lyase family 8 super-sandwich domain-containing protein [Elizabethkingia bruuniana]KGO12018.1 silent information regulator protein Sir2 [Elizabethkingia miricola]AQX83753.1 silent information regulator protein Sir2 [Elizabethkingia bruuniana]KUY22134.1 silent information regulator protein Sir2 [Elizabethkingia bruuniana]OPB62345.1 silent information regulator protein Sir2 [Elizabethkingia bruuniana]QQN57158.1 silent information regulator protein Sir2 [Elizabethkingia bruunian